MITFIKGVRPKFLTGTALVRLDFNTKDDWRMRAVLPTLRFLLKTSSKIVIVSHRGRPTPTLPSKAKPKLTAANKKLSLRKDATELSRLLGKRISFIEHFDFPQIRQTIHDAPLGSIFLLENIRFVKGEQENDPKLGKALASLADFYVNDAFAVDHRANASLVAVTKFLPGYAGFELEHEIRCLSRAMREPKHPLVIILGGAKAADKLGVIEFFKKKAGCFLLGGGPANTILAARHVDVKKSLKDDDKKNGAAIKKIAGYKNILLPNDFVWRRDAIVDIGTKTIRTFNEKIAGAKTILWSGPVGMADHTPYDRGSKAIAYAIVKNRRAFKIAGGGETVLFLKKIRIDTKFSFISTGGSAMLDYLAGKKLPGIEALKKRHGTRRMEHGKN